MPNFSGIWNLKEQVQAIAAGRWTGIPTGELYAWGLNSSGQIGDETVINKSSPVQVAGADWSQISASAYRTFSIKTNGTLWGWGDNVNGAIGDNTVISKSSPVQIGALTTWAQVSSGGSGTFAVKDDNTLWVWGYDFFGSLGIGINFAKRSSPVQVGALTNWAQVSGGLSANTHAVKTDGTLWAWGTNSNGQLGLNNRTNYNSPKQVGALTNWASISDGNAHVTSIKTDGTLWSWGRNASGQLGLNDTIDRSSPVQIGAGTDWASTAAGTLTSGCTAAIKTNGTLWTWGRNNNGQIGIGVDQLDKSSPTQVGALTNWSKIDVGDEVMVSVKTDGTLWSWGRNNVGQNGTNNTIARSSPVQIGSLSSWTEVAVGTSTGVSILQGKTN